MDISIINGLIIKEDVDLNKHGMFLKMPLNKKTKLVPWDFKVEDKNYQEEPWILKKGKEYITIETDIRNKGNFYLQKDNEKRLSLSALQARMTYHQLIDFGYKLQKPKKKK